MSFILVKSFACFLLIVLTSLNVYCQEIDTSIIVGPIIKVASLPADNHLSSSELSFNNDVSFSTIEAIDLSEQLSKEVGLFVRNYGPGSISTLSVLGSSANQTNVYWNGVTINSPTLGLTNISLLPSNLFEDVQLLYGANSTSFGSGSIGGVLKLSSSLGEDSGNVGLLSGSFGQKRAFAKVVKTFNKLSIGLKLHGFHAPLDYSYRVGQNSQHIKLSHNNFSIYSAMPRIQYQFNDHLEFFVEHWYQNSTKEIPPTTRQTSSLAVQNDYFYRTLFGLTSKNSNLQYGITLAYFSEYNDYFDVTQNLDVSNHYKVKHLKSFMKAVHVKDSWHLETFFRNVFGQTGGYDNGITQNQYSFSVQYFRSLSKWKLGVGARLLHVESDLAPISPNFYISYRPNPSIELSGKVNYNYRIPNLNELYWQPGGNLDLVAEQGWNYELGAKARFEGAIIKSSEIRMFTRSINHWIMWVPFEQSPIWGAQNIERVWSRGVLLNSNIAAVEGNSSLNILPSYSFILSEFTGESPNGFFEDGDQLLYTPRHQANLGLIFNWNSFKIQTTTVYEGNFNGVNKDLNPYTIHDISLRYELRTRNIKWYITGNVKNINNKQYEVIEFRPMPGRSVNIQVSINFK